jgi:hypothetical protein
LQFRLVQEVAAIPDGMLLTAADAPADCSPRSVIHPQGEQTAAALAHRIREVMGRILVVLAVAQNLVANVGLAIAIPPLASLPQRHRPPPVAELVTNLTGTESVRTAPVSILMVRQIGM